MDLVSDQRRKDAEMKRTKKIEAIQNILNLKKMSLDMLKIKIQSRAEGDEGGHFYTPKSK